MWWLIRTRLDPQQLVSVVSGHSDGQAAAGRREACEPWMALHEIQEAFAERDPTHPIPVFAVFLIRSINCPVWCCRWRML
jgi:hypothetical protein